MVLFVEPISAVANLISGILGRVIPDQGAQDAANLELARMTLSGELAQRLADTDLSKSGLEVAKAEAASNDPWTSRARPMIIYFFLVLLAVCVMVALVSGVYPSYGVNFGTALKFGLGAIPSELWQTFGFLGGGYIVARSVDKNTFLKAPPLVAGLSARTDWKQP